jgi:hypothetical protein
MNNYKSQIDTAHLQTHTARTTGPAGQILVTAVLIWLLVGACVINWRVQDGWFITFTAGVLAAALHWVFLQRVWLTKLMEVISQTDIDGDGLIGEPVTVNRVLKVQVTHRAPSGNMTGGDYLQELPEDVMMRIAAALAEGASLSVGDMVEKRHAITRGEFDDIAPKLRAAELAEWKNAKFEKLGMRPTEMGKATFDALVQPPTR